MILPYQELDKKHYELIEHPIKDRLNPASIDIGIGTNLLLECYLPKLPLWLNRFLSKVSFILPKNITPKFKKIDLTFCTPENPFYIYPGECILVSTQENLFVPDDLVMEMKLKSSRARELYNHSLAFWFDPGWRGVGTLEIQNISRFSKLPIYPNMKIGQTIYHKLSEKCAVPYRGKYQYAGTVEGSKDEKSNLR